MSPASREMRRVDNEAEDWRSCEEKSADTPLELATGRMSENAETLLFLLMTVLASCVFVALFHLILR